MTLCSACTARCCLETCYHTALNPNRHKTVTKPPRQTSLVEDVKTKLSARLTTMSWRRLIVETLTTKSPVFQFHRGKSRTKASFHIFTLWGQSRTKALPHLPLSFSTSLFEKSFATNVKTQERRGSSFSQLGLEPNHTGLTVQSTLLLEESCRVKRSDIQTFSNFSNYFRRVLKFPKTFSSFSASPIKRLQLKLTNNLQNSYQISSQHQVPKTWVKQHPKTPKPTKTNENPSPSSSMHKLVPFGSKLVTTWFLWVLEFRDWFLQS